MYSSVHVNMMIYHVYFILFFTVCVNPDSHFISTAYFPTLLIQINMDQNHIAHTASSNLPATNDVRVGFCCFTSFYSF